MRLETAVAPPKVSKMSRDGELPRTITSEMSLQHKGLAPKIWDGARQMLLPHNRKGSNCANGRAQRNIEPSPVSRLFIRLGKCSRWMGCAFGKLRTMLGNQQFSQKSMLDSHGQTTQQRLTR